MKYCMNCKQNVMPRRDMSGAKKAVASISVVVCILFGVVVAMVAAYTDEPEMGGVVLVFFFIIAISIPISMYYITGQSCPLCKAEQWGSPQ